jgi:Mce-associated membrane protein
VSLGDHGARERDARAATAAARSALEQLLSYDAATVSAQAGRNAALLTGPFRTEYGTTMTSRIVPLAQKQRAVVRARAYDAGVMSQTDDTVRVQVFLNQARTTPGQKTPAVDQNRVIATMQRVGGRWLVAGLEAY